MANEFTKENDRCVMVRLEGGTDVFLDFPVFSSGDLTILVDGQETDDWTFSGEWKQGYFTDARVRLHAPHTGEVAVYSRIKPFQKCNFGEGAGFPAEAFALEIGCLVAFAQEACRDLELARAEIKTLRTCLEDLKAAQEAKPVVPEPKPPVKTFKLPRPDLGDCIPEHRELPIYAEALDYPAPLSREMPVHQPLSIHIKPRHIRICGFEKSKHAWKPNTLFVIRKDPKPEHLEIAA